LGLDLEVAILWAMQNGYFDDVEVKRIKECQEGLEEFLSTRKQDLLQLILDEKALTDDVVSGLETALKDFKATWS
jgi:F-type H+-transporting ATPase subunit alpha